MSKTNGLRPPFEPFAGFSSPRYTTVPDELFDLLLPRISDAELRVLLYIIRRTFGFKRDSDNISLSQLVSGITTSDGRVLDEGTGLSKATVARGLAGLREKGIIVAERNRSAERGDEATTYRLRFQNEQASPPVSQQRDTPLSQQRDTPVSQVRDTQETVVQETDGSLSNIERSHDHVLEPETEDTPEPRRTAPRQADRGSRNGNTAHISSLGEILTQRETTRLHLADPDRKEPEQPPSTSSAPREGTGAYGTTEEREKLYAYLRDFSAELGDEAQLSSSITQVLKIFNTAHIPMEHWDDHLYRARALTQEHSASITKRSVDPTRLSGKNKFPYFKKVVMSLVSPSGELKQGSVR